MAFKTKSSEHIEQVRLMNTARIHERKYPDLKLLFAIPNQSYGGRRGSVIRGAKFKAEGRKKGVPDLFLPVARSGFHGMFIEMKYGYNKPSAEQKEWLHELEKQGYYCVICYSFEAAWSEIENYIISAGYGGA